MKYLFGILVLCCYLQNTFAQESKESSVEIKPEMLLSVPAKISYQGVLTDNIGNPLDGQYNLNFSLFSSPSGGSPIWGPEEHATVDVDSGIFNVYLGSILSLTNISFDVPYFLEIKVNNTLLSPRTELSSSPYSFNTSRIQGRLVSEDSPNAGEVLKWTGSQWEPRQDDSGGTPSGPAGGDLEGTYPNPKVVRIQELDVSSIIPSNGQVLKWNDPQSRWEPNTDLIGGLTLPYSGTFSNAATAFQIDHNGGNGNIIRLRSNNPSHSDDVLSVVQYGTGPVAEFIMENENSTNEALYIRTDGVSDAAYFRVNNANGGNALYLNSNANQEALYVTTTGTDNAARIQINNSNNDEYALYVTTNSNSDKAGYFGGDLFVNGNLSASGTKPFIIDHPLDPANKYLYHFALESPDVLNVYTGNITTDTEGDATIQLPDYFSVLNSNFRYQLTCVGTFAHAIVLEEVDEGNTFKIKTDVPMVKVSWQIIANRNDKTLTRLFPGVEVEKPDKMKGKYIDPESFGLSEDKSENYKKIKE